MTAADDHRRQDDAAVQPEIGERPVAGPPEQPLTVLLSAAASGDGQARECVWAAVYSELHRMAKAVLARDGVRRSIQPTTLIHEAYLRLVGDGDADWNSRGHFFSAAAIAMRRICVDYARTNRAVKRGGACTPAPLPETGGAMLRRPGGDPFADDAGEWELDDFAALEAAMARLEAIDARKAQVINLRYFAGLTGDETAKCLGVSARTVDNESRLARAWLYREMTGS